VVDFSGYMSNLSKYESENYSAEESPLQVTEAMRQQTSQ